MIAGIIAAWVAAASAVVAFFRGAKLPPSVFDPDDTPPPIPGPEKEPRL